MKKFVRYGVIFIGIIAILLLGAIGYIKTALPNVGPPTELTVELTAERLARGQYLANHVMLCMDCHAQRDFTLFSGPPISGTEGAGGDVFDQSLGFPGSYVARNITPSGIGHWTDGELYRAITTGVSKDGSPLFPVMPYVQYGQCDPEDIKSVIAYIRTLAPVENEPAHSVSDFPINILINTMPQKANPTTLPHPDDYLAYAKYVATAAGCGICHTKEVKGKVVGNPFAGGFEFGLGEFGLSRSANITPHPETGIGNWTREAFIARFKQYADSSYTPHKVKPGEYQTPMPWIMYAGMTERDLGAIYDYLQTLTPYDNKITLFEATKR